MHPLPSTSLIQFSLMQPKHQPPQVEDSLHEVQMYLLLGSHDNIVALR